MSTKNIKLTDELIRDWVKSIERQDLLDLLKNWDIQVKDEHNSKFELFKNAVGNKLIPDRFREFWLLKEKSEFKNKNWILFGYDSSVLKDIKDLDLLEDKIKEILDNKLEKNVDFNIIITRFENLGIYIVFDFKGFPRIIEEFGFNFHLHHSLQRIRCLLGYNDYVQVSGISKNRMNLCLEILQEVIKIKIEDIPIYSYVIRDFINKMKPIEKLVIVCPREMGGFSGVERITVEGPDIVEGMEDLRSRQEILFNFEGLSKLGAWTIVKSKMAKIDVHGTLRLGDEDTKGKILNFLKS